MTWNERRIGQSKGRRRGDVFPIRVTAEERAKLEALQRAGGGPRALGPWLVWRALGGATAQTVLPELGPSEVLPARARSDDHDWLTERHGEFRCRKCWAQITLRETRGEHPHTAAPGPCLGRLDRVVLDLCGGTGAWSAPYVAHGYDVQTITLPADDVRSWVPPAGLRAWGVLAAPPCDQFSLARNGHPDMPRDFAGALEAVCGCLRIIGLVRPKWWALENPTGLLGRWLGTPRDVFEPCDFGDPWTKRTALWGDFNIPARGPFVTPTSGAPQGSYENRARTPPGFARAFFEANP
jgi:hypothetical protein